MANPPEIRGIRSDDIPEAPAWLAKLLRPLNLFLQQVGQSLSGNLTVSQNLAARWVSIDVVGGVLPKPFSVDLGGRPAHAVLLAGVTTPADSPTEAAVLFEWAPANVRGAGGVYSPAVSITRISGVSSGAKATLRFLVLAE